MPPRDQATQTIGYLSVIEELNLKTTPLWRRFYIASRGQGKRIHNARGETVVLPKAYQIKGPPSPLKHIEFALKYEGANLEVLTAAFANITPSQVAEFVREKSTGRYRRILWFLYEWLTGTQLDLPDEKRAGYVPVLNPNDYYSGPDRPSKRHRVNNNLLGDRAFCPLVRRTPLLAQYEEKKLDEAAQRLTQKYHQDVIRRAMHYLFTKETVASYEIERERPNLGRTHKFVELLQKAGETKRLTKEDLIALQNATVDSRFSDSDYRPFQNYVGEQSDMYRQHVHYISPKANDVPDLMAGLFESLYNLLDNHAHPVIVAAVISFGFVYIHPFGDGNGRLHRFLIHYVLAQMGFSPDGFIFPVSAVILRNMKSYDQTLETFSKPLMELIQHYNLDGRGEMTVQEETVQYYRYIDYTPMAEFLFHCVERTVERDFKEELDYLVHYDHAKRALQGIVDMPDRLIDLFIRLCMQNEGKLSARKRERYFSMLTSEEVAEMERAIEEILRPG